MSQTRKNGFSLLELMVVVAIIGVLSTIAYPNYLAMTSRARQAEAKSNLAQMFATEKTFWVEQRSYSMCLEYIGYQAGGQTRRYTTGYWMYGAAPFCGAGGTQDCYMSSFTYGGKTCVCQTGTAAADGTFNNPCTYSASVPDPDPGRDTGNAGLSWGVTKNTFTAGALGRIRVGKPWDIWTIDESRNIVHVLNGE